MTRPWHIWTVFGLCLAVLLAALAWLSAQVVRLDHAEQAARRQAADEESVRLALWRMDSALAPLIARESARPYFAYSPFYPAERAYTRMFNEIDYGEVLVPSPLLTQTSPYILVHFQIDARGKLSSPQVPTGNMRDLAEPRYDTADEIVAAGLRLDEVRNMVSADTFVALPLERPQPVDVVRAPPAPVQEEQYQQSAEQMPQGKQQPSRQQVQRSMAENQARSRAVQQSFVPDNNLWNERAWSDNVTEGILRPVWIGDALVLARRVAVNDQEYVQGCLLDRAAIEKWLLAEIADLFPEARLEPLRVASGAASDRVLAGLPIRLFPGASSFAPVDMPSPLRVSLTIAWVCASVAAIAVVVLLVGTVALSERRAAFVSAVTHELRTPLTTFRLYTEMLVEGMVPDEGKRRSYLNTLQAEAVRLSHLVENVLAYARLERGRLSRRSEVVRLSALVERAESRLAARAEQGGMQLVSLLADEQAQAAEVRADASAVEQILFNLVDNACKYAGDGEVKRIELLAGASDRFGVLRVRDYGLGISADEALRLFKPFHKSARDAANSAPGVGLGLALSRRLARAMAGDLRVVPTDGGGACLELLLPRASR